MWVFPVAVRESRLENFKKVQFPCSSPRHSDSGEAGGAPPPSLEHTAQVILMPGETGGSGCGPSIL